MTILTPKRWLGTIAVALLATIPAADAIELTVRNDAATGGAQAQPCMCFIPGDEAAAWLTATCSGDIVAVQVFWESPLGGQPDLLEDSISIYGAGTFPNPGTVLQNSGAVPATIQTPTLSDGAFNEYRFLDPANPTPQSPLQVPVTSGQTFVVSLKYLNDSSGGLGATTAWDQDGCQGGKNTVQTGGTWLDACPQGVQGDWIIRAVIDCEPGSIPATSAWGLALLALCLPVVAVVILRRRGIPAR